MLASGQYSASATATCQSTLVHSSTTSSLSSPRKSAGSQSGHYTQGSGQSQYPPSDEVSSRPSPNQEHVFPSLRPLSDHVLEASLDNGHMISTREHVPKSQFFPSRILTPPDKLHPTLSCWIKNMNMLSSLIDRLQELASSTPAERRSRLLRQAAELRATSKKQKEHFTEFLQLSEEYASRYLLDISDEIKQQSFLLEKLEGRLEAAKKLRGEAIDLQKLYESGTVATMKGLRATGKAASYRLQTPDAKYRNFYFQHCRGHFQRTELCSTRWIWC